MLRDCQGTDPCYRVAGNESPPRNFETNSVRRFSGIYSHIHKYIHTYQNHFLRSAAEKVHEFTLTSQLVIAEYRPSDTISVLTQSV